MNEYVQTFMLTHNFEMNVDVTTMNPDNMSYEVTFLLFLAND